MLKLLPIQKMFCDKPMAFTFRMYDGALVIGNVRLPSCADHEDMSKAFEAMAGRYKVSNPLPPLTQPSSTVTKKTSLSSTSSPWLTGESMDRP